MNNSKKIILILIVISFIISSCVTNANVTFESNVEGAELFIDGTSYGKMPTQITLSNAVWEDPQVIVKKEGYRPSRKKLEKVIQPVNTVVGVLLFWPSLLWCYGPAPYQYYELYPETN